MYYWLLEKGGSARCRPINCWSPSDGHLVRFCRIRDTTMADLGIRMEDRPDGSSVWMAEDPEELQAERRERESAARAAYLLKRTKALEERERLEAKLKKLEKLPTVQEALGATYSR